MVVYVRIVGQQCRIALVRVGRWDVIGISMEVVSSCYFLVTEVGLWVRRCLVIQAGKEEAASWGKQWILGSHWKIERKG